MVKIKSLSHICDSFLLMYVVQNIFEAHAVSSRRSGFRTATKQPVRVSETGNNRPDGQNYCTCLNLFVVTILKQEFGC